MLFKLSYQVVSNFRIPKISEILIHEIKSENEDLKRFLLNSIPKKLTEFVFNSVSKTQINLKCYFNNLRFVATRITQRIAIYNLNISLIEFCLLITSTKNIKKVWIWSWNILTDSECNFKDMRGCKISLLDLEDCGNENYSNWTKNKSRLFNILSGVSSCQSLRESLKEINLKYKCTLAVISKIRQEISCKFKGIDNIKI